MRSKSILVVVMVVLVLLIGTSAYAENIPYKLMPGSTITPVYGPDPVGPTEALTGTFQWYADWSDLNLIAYNASQLYFESDSFTVSLNTTPLNEYATSVFKDSQDTYFMELVDLTGLPITTGMLECFTVGAYSGPSSSPLTLDYPDVRITPLEGGFFRAKLTIVAEQIPEPTTLLLLGLGAVMLRLSISHRKLQDETDYRMV